MQSHSILKTYASSSPTLFLCRVIKKDTSHTNTIPFHISNIHLRNFNKKTSKQQQQLIHTSELNHAGGNLQRPYIHRTSTVRPLYVPRKMGTFFKLSPFRTPPDPDAKLVVFLSTFLDLNTNVFNYSISFLRVDHSGRC